MKDKLKNKKVIGIIAVVVLVIAGFLYSDYSKAQKILAKDIQTTKQESIMIFNNSNSTTKTATSKESSLRKSYDKEAKEKALKKMEEKGKYGKYTYTNSEGKKVSCNREKPAPTYSYSGGSSYSGGYNSGSSYSGSSGGGSNRGSGSSSSSSGGSSSGNWTINGGTIDLGTVCHNCGIRYYGAHCPNCGN